MKKIYIINNISYKEILNKIKRKLKDRLNK